MSKISCFVCGEHINYLPKPKAEANNLVPRALFQIIDLRDTDKSRYYAITEFNNCFIIRSPSFFFNEYPREAKRSAIFTKERSQEGEKTRFPLRMCRILFAAKHSWTALRMSRPLFAGHVVGSRPMKKKKNLLQMIINNYNTFLLFYSPKPRSQA